jgi:hypothetical protein
MMLYDTITRTSGNNLITFLLEVRSLGKGYWLDNLAWHY